METSELYLSRDGFLLEKEKKSGDCINLCIKVDACAVAFPAKKILLLRQF
jgi:hypothetical protein